MKVYMDLLGTCGLEGSGFESLGGKIQYFKSAQFSYDNYQAYFENSYTAIMRDFSCTGY